MCVSAFDDPKVPGVACHVSQARTGGLTGTIGLAEDPSRFSIACRQVGPITVDAASLTDGEQVYSARTSIFFKRTHVYRMVDKKRNTLVCLAISDKLIEGSPQNSISTVPIMPWAPAANISIKGALLRTGHEEHQHAIGALLGQLKSWRRKIATKLCDRHTRGWNGHDNSLATRELNYRARASWKG